MKLGLLTVTVTKHRAASLRQQGYLFAVVSDFFSAYQFIVKRRCLNPFRCCMLATLDFSALYCQHSAVITWRNWRVVWRSQSDIHCVSENFPSIFWIILSKLTISRFQWNTEFGRNLAPLSVNLSTAPGKCLHVVLWSAVLLNYL